MKKMAVVFAALALSACAGGRSYAPLPPPPPVYAPPAKPLPATPKPSETVQKPAPQRVPQNVPSAGPLKTAMIGGYMDNQERDLRTHLRGTGVLVSRPGDEIVLTAHNDLLFEGNTTKITLRGSNALAKIAIIARHYDHTHLEVGGYTDTTGTPEQNQAVSEKRAKAVADALIADGVSAGRISSQGFGETRLKVKTGENVSQPRNRRIEIRISPEASG